MKLPVGHIGPYWLAKWLTYLKVHAFRLLIVKAGHVVDLNDDSNLRSGGAGNNPQTVRVVREWQTEHAVGILDGEKNVSVRAQLHSEKEQNTLKPVMTW